ncbi:phenylacetate--CoA ligase family protein [Roseomonas sp. AR75]|uniref:phenylacetate--CoA ligase family protein n=1 Tax=Roseomonas sp. AR75 TaxID=2562311 RepID=UPI0010BF8907|nr:AMP-binding protein [Roseomonas sp. AR75]
MIPDSLRLPHEQLRRIQDAKLRHMIALCRRGHPWYREAWKDVDLDAVQGIADIWRLPLTPKRAMMETPQQFRLDCPDLPVPERAIWEVVHTTGSSGDPTPIYNTTWDYHGYLLLNRRVAEIAGIGDRDVIANLFPLTAASMGAFIRSATLAYSCGASVAASLGGAPVAPFGIQKPMEEAVRLVERHRATVLLGVTSFVRRVLIRAQELGADFRSVRMAAVTGEASTPGLRDDMRRLMRELGCAGTIIFDRYGSTESGGLAQCREEADWHNPTPELLYHEVVDPETGRPMPEGERGHLAITHLDRRGTVLMRYLVGDIVSIARDPCPHCGRGGERLVGPVVRTKDLLKVKGMLINPTALLQRLQAMPAVEEFQVVVDRTDPADPFSMDELFVRVAPRGGMPQDEVAQDVAAATQATIGVRPRVTVEDRHAIYDGQQAKAVRFVDRRTH